MTLPAERKVRIERTKSTDRKLDHLREESEERVNNWGLWKDHVEGEIAKRHENAIYRMEKEGKSTVHDRVSGKYLLQGTGVEGQFEEGRYGFR